MLPTQLQAVQWMHLHADQLCQCSPLLIQNDSNYLKWWFCQGISMWFYTQNIWPIIASRDVCLLCIMLEKESFWLDCVSFVFFSTQSQSPATTRTLLAQTETASPPDFAVMGTMTAWIIQMRPVFEICVPLTYKSKRELNPH